MHRRYRIPRNRIPRRLNSLEISRTLLRKARDLAKEGKISENFLDSIRNSLRERKISMQESQALVKEHVQSAIGNISTFLQRLPFEEKMRAVRNFLIEIEKISEEFKISKYEFTKATFMLNKIAIDAMYIEISQLGISPKKLVAIIDKIFKEKFPKNRNSLIISLIEKYLGVLETSEASRKAKEKMLKELYSVFQENLGIISERKARYYRKKFETLTAILKINLPKA